jgi:hypothetical protein
MKTNRIIWGVVSLVVLFTVAVSLNIFESYGQENSLQQSKATPTPEIKDIRDLSKYGSVDYNAPQIENSAEWEKRRKISQRYDNQDWVFKSQSAEPGGVGKITEDTPPPLFPIDESPLVVVGEITTVDTFLSNDKGGVYTEFTIRVDEVLKDNGGKNRKKIVADREGGVVVYPNGARVMYQSSDRALPLLGSKYLFFLMKDELSPNYEILTSYYFDGNRIWQMEQGRPFEEFKNVNKTDFIEAVRNKIAQVQSNKQ